MHMDSKKTKLYQKVRRPGKAEATLTLEYGLEAEDGALCEGQ